VFGPVTEDTKAVLAHSADEAARRGDRRIGTDHLLLGLLHDPGVASALGTDVGHARGAAQDLDRAALAALGIDLETMPDPSAPRVTSHAPLTSGFRAVMVRAVTLASTEQVRKVEPRHLLAALMERRQPDPAATLLDAMKIRPGRSSPPTRRAGNP
jgi:ATP-dependent Clp protease ATP-binding subunit ClpA